jgi:hypothetical protein
LSVGSAGVEALLQSVSVASVQVHTEALQAEAAGQTMPQPPQLAESLVVSTHAPPAGHSGKRTLPFSGHWQTLASQTCPPVQAVPQRPQLLASEVRFTQTPEQRVEPGAHTQVPP